MILPYPPQGGWGNYKTKSHGIVIEITKKQNYE